MHNLMFYLLMLLISTPALAAESWVEAPAMTVTVKATAVTSVCDIRVAEDMLLSPALISGYLNPVVVIILWGQMIMEVMTISIPRLILRSLVAVVNPQQYSEHCG